MDPHSPQRIEQEKKPKNLLDQYEKICHQISAIEQEEEKLTPLSVSLDRDHTLTEKELTEREFKRKLFRRRQKLEHQERSLRLSLSVFASISLPEDEEDLAVRSDDEEGCGRVTMRRGFSRRRQCQFEGRRGRPTRRGGARGRGRGGGGEGGVDKYEKLLRVLVLMERKAKTDSSLWSDPKFLKRVERLQEMEKKMKRGPKEEERKRMLRKKEEGEEGEDVILRVGGLRLNDD